MLRKVVTKIFHLTNFSYVTIENSCIFHFRTCDTQKFIFHSLHKFNAREFLNCHNFESFSVFLDFIAFASLVKLTWKCNFSFARRSSISSPNNSKLSKFVRKIRSAHIRSWWKCSKFFISHMLQKSAANVTIFFGLETGDFWNYFIVVYTHSLYDSTISPKHYENALFLLRIIRFTAELSSDRSERFYGNLVTERLANIFSFLHSTTERKASGANNERWEGEERMKRTGEVKQFENVRRGKYEKNENASSENFREQTSGGKTRRKLIWKCVM